MVFHVKYQDKPYLYTIISVSVAFILIVIFITLVMGLILIPIETNASLFDPASREAIVNFFSDVAPLKAGVAWILVVATTQLSVQVSQKFGRGNFWNLLIGKYQNTREETRTFMFLDLNASTSIAEKLGDSITTYS